MDFFISLDKIDEYCTKKGIDISDKERDIINSIFSKSDKKNLQNEEVTEGDSLLDSSEQDMFFAELKNNAKNIFDKLCSFIDDVNNKRQSKNYVDVASNNFITIVEDSDRNNSSDISNLKYFLNNLDNNYLFEIIEKVNEIRPGDFFTGIRGFFRKMTERIDNYDNPNDENYKTVLYVKEKIIKYKDYLLSYAKEKGIKYTQDYEKRFDDAITQNNISNLAIAMDRLCERIIVAKRSLSDITESKKSTIEIKQPNGEIDEDFAQGITGDCWLLSCIKSITTNKDVLKMLNDKISVQKDGENIVSVTVNIQGKDYIISYDELINANEYSTGDLDIRAIEIAANRFRLENGELDISFGGKTEDGFAILFGEENIDIQNHYFDIQQSDKDNYIKQLKATDGMSVIGTKVYYNENEEYFGIDDEGKKVKIQQSHAYIVTKADDKYIYLINPWESNKVIKFEIDEIGNAFERASIIKIKNNSETKEQQETTIKNINNTSKNTYTKQIQGNKIVITVVNTSQSTIIDTDVLLEPFNSEEKEKIYNVIKDLPAEVLIDLSIEVTFSKKEVKGKALGQYVDSIDKILLSGGDYSAETIVHELGHALDSLKKRGTLKSSFSTDYNKKFRKAFVDELKVYLKAEKIKWGKMVKKDGKDNYCTTNLHEMFATCYTLLMLGDCQSRLVIEKYFPQTLAVAQSIIEEIRLLDDSQRH